MEGRSPERTADAPSPSGGLARAWPWPAGAAALLLGLALSLHYAWTGDDFYIGLRYAKNFVAGHGLVFNPGERVEGYTNFLWVLWTALGLKTSVAPEAWSNLGSIACYLAALALLFANHLRARALGAAGGWALPAAALLGAVTPDWNSYATSGLETSCYAMLLLAGFLLLTWDECTLRRCFGAGLVLGLANLTRPDAAILGVLGGLFVLWRGRDRLRCACVYAGAFALVWYPHMYWRMSYYEDVFPNTYYAKSAYDTYYAQGWMYLKLFFARYWILGCGLAMAVPVAAWLRKPRADLSVAERWASGQCVLAAAFVAAYTFYVVRVGGDFMYARLLVPTIPFYLVLVEHALLHWGRAPRIHLGLAAGLALVLLFMPSPSGDELQDGVVDERLNYRRMEPMLVRKTETLKKYLDGLPVRIGIFGSEARLTCQLETGDFVECHGLCDRLIAHSTLAARGLVGHEKRPTPNYLVMQRKVHLTFGPDRRLRTERSHSCQTMLLGKISCTLLHWDAKLMADLKARGAVFADFPALLDAYAAELDKKSDEEVRRNYAKFVRFYFAHNDDPARENLFRARLGLPQRSR
ncbi:MAG: hypothetical protein KIS92_07885 [Planctomycetota bacterium]|nr:hypothetical protein [Planctomycetota bacterium]